jgi:hypothetical protein
MYSNILGYLVKILSDAVIKYKAKKAEKRDISKKILLVKEIASQIVAKIPQSTFIHLESSFFDYICKVHKHTLDIDGIIKDLKKSDSDKKIFENEEDYLEVVSRFIYLSIGDELNSPYTIQNALVYLESFNNSISMDPESVSRKHRGHFILPNIMLGYRKG